MRRNRKRVLAVALALVLLSAAVVAYGRWFEPLHPVVDELVVELPGLPQEADGFRIAFIADLHLDHVGARERRVHSLVADADVDLLLVGGDFVDVPYSIEDYQHRTALACSVLARLPSRLGNVAVWGNNDLPYAARDIANEWGIHVLENQQTTISIPGGELRIVGIDDPVTGRADYDSAFTPEPVAPYIVMAHSPDAFPAVAARGAPLLLAGHTHGGQIWMPSFLPQPRRILRLRKGTPSYRAGRYREDRSTLYVTRGVGTSYVRFRLFCRPEVTILTLRAPGLTLARDATNETGRAGVGRARVASMSRRCYSRGPVFGPETSRAAARRRRWNSF